MPAEISIIVPTLNVAPHLPRCLGALMEGLSAGLIRELIVTDGGSQDATLDIADEAGAVLVKGPASRGGQLRRGCAVARGAWLLVVHADTVLDPGWAQQVAAHISGAGPEGTGAGPAYFRLAFDAPGLRPRWVAGWANLRAALFGLPYGDQGLLVRQSDYLSAGGYPDQPLMEDVALARELPGKLTVLPTIARTSAEKYVRDGWLRRGLRNQWTLARYFAGTDPDRLAADYQR